MVKAIRDTEKLIGKTDYIMTDKKVKSRQFARSLYVVKDINEGEKFNTENIKSIRPGYGLHPKYLDNIIDKICTKNVERGTALTWDLINHEF